MIKLLFYSIKNTKSDRINEFGSDGFESLNELLSLEALAQHYGIPTRLMDWTRNPFIAAFFAGENALNNKYKSSTHLVVWAFYFPVLGKHYKLSRSTDPITVITAPSATNPNLKSQQGVFTLVNFLSEKNEKDEYIPMDEMLEERAQKAIPEQSDADKLIVECKLQKFTLPVSESSELLYLLAKLDITPSAIYPGFHSVISDIQMQNLFTTRFAEI